MEVFVKHLHSFLAYLFLVSTFVSVIYAVSNYRKNEYSSTQFSLAKLAFIASHIQLLVGLVLWYVNGWFSQLTSNTSVVMKDSSLRLVAMEHPLINIIAIAIVTIGYIKVKKASTALEKNKFNLWFYLVALVLILSRIPWQRWIHDHM
jgi:hypothetical protein